MTSDISVPPTKKRRSKWDMVTTETETTTSGAAAAAAAAKINAMLAAKGKLTKPDNVILPPTKPTPLGTLTRPTIGRATLLAPPQNAPLLYSTPPSSHSFIQEKVFVGLEGASNQFNLADRVKGPDNSYLNHISAQTGGKAFLRGKGSGFIEPTSGKESFEALHIFISHVNQEGVNNARKLCQSLVDTVKKDSIAHKASQSGPLGFGAAPHYNSNAGTAWPDSKEHPTRKSRVTPPFDVISGGPALVNPYSLQAPNYHGYRAPPPPHDSFYHHPAPQGHHPYNYPGPLPGGYYAPEQPPYPYCHPPPPQDVNAGLPNAFVDYRPFDKVDVANADVQVKRGFTEEADNSVPVQTEPGTKRKFIEVNVPTTRCVEKQPPVSRTFTEEFAPSNRNFTEKPAEVVTGSPNDSELIVGRWQTLSQPSTIRRIALSEAKEIDKTKDLMPPPSLPGGLKGQKLKQQDEAAVEGGNEKNVGVNMLGLAHYADDSDSDNDS
ncbi:KH homology domain-containing protein 4-like isoform X3 [Halichondria panicea]|uniref:KH homology domain-containing protein 4-like isoform X3 n=1 Tax=Halichondria panicea TaxID=6063 RepID=UPI00312B43D9